MLEKALKYIVNLATPEILDVNGESYSDRALHRISFNPKAEAIKLTTLSSLVDYISAGVDSMDGTMFIHVESPTRVRMYSQLDYEREREYMVEVNAQLPAFEFNRFIDHESFCIAIQSKFIDTYDRALLLRFAGTVEAGTVAEYGDDGITQKATIKTGIAAKEDAIVPNPVQLMAYRTFLEVEQPMSSYIFRMQGERNVQCALFEADGGAWKLEAMRRIKLYLETCLEGLDGFIVIS